MAYEHIRFIGYTVGTMPGAGADGKPAYRGLLTGQPPATSPLDLTTRCELMLRAMRVAASKISTLPASSPPAAILNVFMAPEFFFRGPMGAYQMAECQQLIAQLQEMVATAEWSDWLFVFGSIMGVSVPAVANATEAYNFTLVQLGGPGNTGGVNANVVLKELLSRDDFIDATAYPTAALVGNVAYLDAGGAGPGLEQQRVAYDGAGVFTQCGITWGVEICLDHDDNISQTGRLQRSPQMPGQPQIQVQLVPSGGMSIRPGSVMAMPGGYVFNCDGTAAGSAELQQAGGPGLAPAASAPVPQEPLNNTASPPDPVAVAQLYTQGPGQVVLFPPVPVPPPALVPGTWRDLVWLAAPGLTITFRLVLNTQGQIVTVLCLLDAAMLDLSGRSYYLPLSLQTTIAPYGHSVSFNIAVQPGAAGYSGGIYCSITMPQFDFDGYALLFDDSSVASPKPDQTCW